MSELKNEMKTKVVEVRSLKIYGNPNGEKEGLVVFLKVREAFPLNATGEPENFTVHCSFERFGGGGRAAVVAVVPGVLKISRKRRKFGDLIPSRSGV